MFYWKKNVNASARDFDSIFAEISEIWDITENKRIECCLKKTIIQGKISITYSSLY